MEFNMKKFIFLLSIPLVVTIILLAPLFSHSPRIIALADHLNEVNCNVIFSFEESKYVLEECNTLVPTDTPLPTDTSVPTDTNTPVLTNTNVATATNTARASRTPTPTNTSVVTATNTVTPTNTVVPTDTPAPTDTPVVSQTPAGTFTPFPSAPLCATHDSNDFYHSLWNSQLGCHYNHEHGQNPFVPEVANKFPGFDLFQLLGNVEIGHTNPSSPMENTHKHAGFKWDVTLSHSDGCAGREGRPTGIDALAVQYHGFGDYSIEFESRIHSAVALFRQCQVGNPTDYGYVFVNQHQDYGQRTAPYQGTILPYPDTPLPAYESPREPYFAIECFNGNTAPCNRNGSLQDILNNDRDTSTTWISEPQNIVGSGSELFAILFRARDIFQVLDITDLTYPFTFKWLCSNDGGNTYTAIPGCRYNNSTTRVHEMMGTIPQSWDNLSGFDTNPVVGRITAVGFVTRFGTLNQSCTVPAVDCHPIKLVNAFTGGYGTGFDLVNQKIDQFDPLNLPERDIYFCNGIVCGEFDTNSVSSGWIESEN
jgi:hypothetical protein